MKLTERATSRTPHSLELMKRLAEEAGGDTVTVVLEVGEAVTTSVTVATGVAELDESSTEAVVDCVIVTGEAGSFSKPAKLQ